MTLEGVITPAGVHLHAGDLHHSLQGEPIHRLFRAHLHRAGHRLWHLDPGIGARRTGGLPTTVDGSGRGSSSWSWGLMFYTVYIPRYSWMSRLLMVTLMGHGGGVAFSGLRAPLHPQLTASFLPLLKPGAAILLFNNVVIVVTIITVMTYFFFSFEHRSRAVRGTASLGRWLLMVAFGAIFGSTVMARMALLTYRLCSSSRRGVRAGSIAWNREMTMPPWAAR